MPQPNSRWNGDHQIANLANKEDQMGIRLSKSEAASLGIKAVGPAMKRGPNKLESAYMAYLAGQKGHGYIIDFGFEAIKLKIGVKRCWYTPDFWVMTTRGLEFHETKGFMRDDARCKLQSAARQYPLFRFVLIKRDMGGFSTEDIE